MEDIGLSRQAWKWLQSQEHIYSRSRTAIGGCGDEIGMFVEWHWPMLCSECARTGRLFILLLIYWQDYVVRGFRSFIGLGSASLLLIMWSCLLSVTSISCLVYVLLSMVCFLVFPLATLASCRRAKGKILFGILLKYERSEVVGRDDDLWLRVGQDVHPNIL